MSAINAMYADTSTMVKLNGGLGGGFGVKVGVYDD